MTSSPPPLLTGAVLLYWGYLTGHLAAAIPAAALLEARSLLKIRWDFKYDSYIKAWHFSILCAVLAALLAWINGMKVWHIHVIFVWAPFILLPVEMAQRYGKAAKMPLNTFSFFASRQMKQDIKKGRKVSPHMINTSYPYIAVTLLATAKASRDDLIHFVGLSIIISICLYASMRKNGYRPWAWGSAITLMVIMCFFAQWSMLKLHFYFRNGGDISIDQNISTNEAKTRIGKLGKIKLSPRIFWRMEVSDGKVPRLINSATYNRYSKANWAHEFIISQGNIYDEFGYRGYSTAALISQNDRDIRWFTQMPPTLTKPAAIRIIGKVDAKVKERPLPLPHNFQAIGDLDAESDIECNRLGTVRMANPNYNVVEYSVWPGKVSTTEEPPDRRRDPRINLDLNIPGEEKQALQRVCRQLDLYNEELTTRAKIRKIRGFFLDEFSYTTHLTTPRFDRGKRHSSIGIFLEDSRSGHCEYFATATTLLLREAGIPARYCVGFAVNEYDRTRNEWVMRGHHAHAWCRAWIEERTQDGKMTGHWENVDLTPPSWQSMDLGNAGGWNQKIADWWQRAREDFLIWRTRDSNKTMVSIVIASIISLMILWICWRLWGSRQREDRHGKALRYIAPENSPATPLHKLEHLAAKKIGRRPVGTPLCKWLEGMLSADCPSRDSLEKLLIPAITLHSTIRFDPAGGAILQREQLDELCAALRQAIKKIP